MKLLKYFKFIHKPEGEIIKCLFANFYGYEILTYFKIFKETNTFQSFTTFSWANYLSYETFKIFQADL